MLRTYWVFVFFLKFVLVCSLSGIANFQGLFFLFVFLFQSSNPKIMNYRDMKLKDVHKLFCIFARKLNNQNHDVSLSTYMIHISNYRQLTHIECCFSSFKHTKRSLCQSAFFSESGGLL